MLALLAAFLASPLFAEPAFQQLLDSTPGQSAAAPTFEAAFAAPGAPTRKAVGIGLSHSGDPFDIPDFPLQQIASMLKEAGGTHYRPHLPMNEAVPEVSAAMLEKLKAAGSDPALFEALTDELAREGRWERMDGLVSTIAGSGIKLILVVGAGYRKEAPLYTTPEGKQDRVSPDRIGRDRYITLARWIAGAGVRRYGDRVEVWQVENEINVAGICKKVGWRVDEKSWSDKEYLKRLIAALSDTVHSEGRRLGRDLKTTHNFATDVGWKGWVSAAEVAQLDFRKDIGAYGPLGLDIIGLDSYANYFYGWPMHEDKLGKIVTEAKAAAGGRPVWILETGFPGAPSAKGFSEARQGEYFRGAFDSAFGAGADVVLAFGWFWNPRGWYTDNPKPLPWWHPQACEQYWSPIQVTPKPDGSKDVYLGKAWEEFKSASKRWLKD